MQSGIALVDFPGHVTTNGSRSAHPKNFLRVTKPHCHGYFPAAGTEHPAKALSRRKRVPGSIQSIMAREGLAAGV